MTPDLLFRAVAQPTAVQVLRRAILNALARQATPALGACPTSGPLALLEKERSVVPLRVDSCLAGRRAVQTRPAVRPLSCRPCPLVQVAPSALLERMAIRARRRARSRGRGAVSLAVRDAAVVSTNGSRSQSEGTPVSGQM